MSNPEVNCSNCVGACCVDSIVVLSADEAVFLDINGTELYPILRAFINIEPTEDEIEQGALSSWSDLSSIKNLEKRVEEAEDEKLKSFWEGVIIDAQKMQPGDGLYSLIGRCGLLDDNNQCIAYDDRPRVCQSFIVGEEACMTFRKRENVPTPVSIITTQD